MSKKKIDPKLAVNPRYQSLLLLEKVTKNQAYSNLLISDQIQKSQMSAKDARLFTEIVYGTISRQLTLDYYLEPFIKGAKKIDPWVRSLLRLSLYQLLYLDRVPDYSILNDAVEIAKSNGNQGVGKFVNGVLRNVQRKGVRSTEEVKDPIERLSIEISIPQWLTEKLVQDYGFEQAQAIGFSLFERSRVSGRVTNPVAMSRTEILNELTSEGIEAVESQVSPVGVIAEKGVLAQSRVFRDGQLTIQDESSMLVAPAMQIEPQHIVLDACAAPGGKTTHIASYLDVSQGGKVIALDIHQHKLKLIEENARRLHVAAAIKPQLLDARKVKETFSDETFDRILVDAPCSGLGLMRRKPDMKYTKKREDFLHLQKIQLEILESIASKVKKYGIITYSTCTIVPEENKQVIQKFLSIHPEFEVIPPKGCEHLTKSLHEDQLQLLPSDYGTDGFFICCLRRKG